MPKPVIYVYICLFPTRSTLLLHLSLVLLQNSLPYVILPLLLLFHFIFLIAFFDLFSTPRDSSPDTLPHYHNNLCLLRLPHHTFTTFTTFPTLPTFTTLSHLLPPPTTHSSTPIPSLLSPYHAVPPVPQPQPPVCLPYMHTKKIVESIHVSSLATVRHSRCPRYRR